MDHQYSLKWNNHPQNIATVFTRLRNEELFVDVSLATCDRQIIRAHRLVLSAGSGYLEKILGSNPSEHPTIVLSTLRYKELKLLVDFMYSGEISVDQPLLAGLLEAANWLQIKGLYENKMEPDPDPAEEPPVAVREPDQSPPSPEMREETEQPSRKRARSEASEHELRSESPAMSESETSFTTPAKISKPVFGCANNGWIMDSIREKSPDNLVKPENDDIPNLLSLANRQNFFQHFKTEVPKPMLDPSLFPSEQMLQAMQLCGTSYLSQLAALQNKSFPSFTGSFTSFTPGSPSGGFKSELLSSAPVRRYKQYSEDSLQAALKEIMEGQSINRSSMKHNIPARTLRDWMKRLNIKSVYTHHSSSKDKDGSVGSTSPEPDLSLALEKFRNAAFSGGLSGNTSADMDEDESEILKIDESCQNLNSVEMTA